MDLDQAQFIFQEKYNITSVEYDNDWFNKIKLILNKYKSTKFTN